MSDQIDPILPAQPENPPPPADAPHPTPAVSADGAPTPSPAPEQVVPDTAARDSVIGDPLAASPPPDVREPAARPKPPAQKGDDDIIDLDQGNDGLGFMVTGDKVPKIIAELPARQYRAMIYMERGDSVIRIAEQLQVSRGTVYHWMNNDARFIAAMRTFRALNHTESSMRMSAMHREALDHLVDQIHHGNTAVAQFVVRTNLKDRVGTTNPKVIAARLARRDKRHALEIDSPAPASDPPRITSTIAKKKKALPPASDAAPAV